MRQVFSLRAATRADVDRFLQAARRAGAALFDVAVHPEPVGKDVELEFTTAAKHEQLDAVLMDSLHTGQMRRTLRPVSREDNPMTFGPQLAIAG